MRDAWRFTHLIGVLLFMLAHGTSVAVLLRLRKTREPNELRSLLTASGATMPALYVGFLMLLGGGIGAGVSGGWWSDGFLAAGWLWSSILILFLVSAQMSMMPGKAFRESRALLAEDPVDRSALEETLAKASPHLTLTIGAAALMGITYLMIAKPF